MRRIAVLIITVLGAMTARQAAAQQACPSMVVTNNNDVVNGDTSSPCALIANSGGDGISLREALLAANNATGSGTVTITFAPSLAGATIALTERFAPITRSQITLTGPTSGGLPNLTVDATSASNAGAIFFIAASQFTMSGLNVINIPTNFTGMQIGGSGYSLTGQPASSPAQLCCVQIVGNAFSNGTSANTFGIFVPSNISNETISNLIIANNSFSQLFEGINFQGGGPGASNSLIEDVIVFGNSFSQMTSNATSAVEVGNSGGTNTIVQGVQVVQNTFTGNFQGVVLDNNGSATGAATQNTLIARNTFSGNLGALGIVAGVDSTSANNQIVNTQIVDNLIDLTGYNGQGSATIQIIDSQSGGTNNKVTGVSFVNDTIYNGTSGAPPGWGVWVTSNSGGVSGVSISNTIFWGNESNPPLNGISSPSQVTNSIIDQSGFTGVNDNINSDPLFVNSAGSNFYLQAGSPARGAGTNTGAPSVDLTCQPRAVPPAIGAYEFQGPNICPSAYSSPLALTAAPASGPAPLAVTFNASGLPPFVTYTINFGDGSTGTITQGNCLGIAATLGGQGGLQCFASASHSYVTSGIYTATLVSTSGGKLSDCATITVSTAPTPPKSVIYWKKAPIR